MSIFLNLGGRVCNQFSFTAYKKVVDSHLMRLVVHSMLSYMAWDAIQIKDPEQTIQEFDIPECTNTFVRAE